MQTYPFDAKAYLEAKIEVEGYERAINWLKEVKEEFGMN